MKITAYISALIVGSFFIFSYASALQLNRIGSLDLGGKKYSEWWYTGTYPTLYGTADANADVNVDISGKVGKAKADSSGNWSYFTASDKGDYKITLNSGDQTYSFTLHLGQNLPAVVSTTPPETTQTTTPVPVTGFNQVVALSLGAGILLFASYLYVWGGTPSKHLVFEKKILRE